MMYLRERLVLLVGWAVGATALGVACSVARAPSGPPPVYEPPRVLPWDAGAPPPADDPFAAAAEGQWLDDLPEEEGAAATAGGAPAVGTSSANSGASGASPATPTPCAAVDAVARAGGAGSSARHCADHEPRPAPESVGRSD